MIMKPLEGRTAIVTGAGKGIGMGIAREMALAGASVVINYSFSEAGAAKVRDDIIAEGGKAMIFKADVSQEAEVKAMFQAAFNWTGRIDILVNNAALQTNVGFRSYRLESFDSLVKVNLKGYYLCTREAAKYMVPNKSGVILYNSSVHAKRATEFDPVYCMTKGGIKMLEREATLELGPKGIRTLCMEPGGVRIEAPKSGNEGQMIEPKYLIQEKHFQFRKGGGHRPMVPADMGKMAVYLASDECELINGGEIPMDAGDMLY